VSLPEGYGKRICIMDADLPNGLDLYSYNKRKQIKHLGNQIKAKKEIDKELENLRF
jgi:hypothetical protein